MTFSLVIKLLRRLVHLLIALAALCLAGLAAAQQTLAPQVPVEQLPTSVGTALTSGYDSNVTRQPSGPLAVGSTIDRAELFANFDHVYERQHVYASADAGREVYKQYSLYDFAPQTYRAGLQSSLPGSVSTDITFTRTVQLAHQADFQNIQRDVLTQNRVDAGLHFPLATEWNALITGSAGQLRNSNVQEVPTNLNAAEVDAGVRYQTGALNYVDFLARSQNATFPEGSSIVYGETSYHEQGVDLRTKWRFSGASELFGHVGYVERKYPSQTYLNFAGPAYELSYLWTPLAKSSLTLYALRATGAPGDNFYLSAVTHAYRVTPAYAPTEKLRFEGYAESAHVNYFGDLLFIQSGQSPVTTRNDALTFLGLTAVWTPQRWLELRLELHRDQRDSSVQSWDYIDRVAMLTAKARF